MQTIFFSWGFFDEHCPIELGYRHGLWGVAFSSSATILIAFIVSLYSLISSLKKDQTHECQIFMPEASLWLAGCDMAVALSSNRACYYGYHQWCSSDPVPKVMQLHLKTNIDKHLHIFMKTWLRRVSRWRENSCRSSWRPSRYAECSVANTTCRRATVAGLLHSGDHMEKRLVCI